MFWIIVCFESSYCFRRWITWSPSSLTVTAGQNWPRNVWLRPRKRSALRLQRRWAHKDVIILSFELIITQVLYWLVGFVSHHSNLFVPALRQKRSTSWTRKLESFWPRLSSLGLRATLMKPRRCCRRWRRSARERRMLRWARASLREGTV